MAYQDENRGAQAQLSEYERMIGYDVEDKDGGKVGTVETLWEDHTGQPAFLGIRTGWLGLGKIHVVPAHYAAYSDRSHAIRLPFDEETIKSAPDFDAESEFTDEGEARLYDYYQGRGIETSFHEGDIRDTEADRDRTVSLSEERLNVGKREVEAGGVRLRKVIKSETVNQPVELKREEIEIERVPASGRGDSDFREEDIYIPLRREVAETTKETQQREEIRLKKKTETDREQVSGDVRREDVEIDREGDSDSRRSI